MGSLGRGHTVERLDFFSIFLYGTCVEFTNEQRHFKFPTKKISDGIFKGVYEKYTKKNLLIRQ